METKKRNILIVVVLAVMACVVVLGMTFYGNSYKAKNAVLNNQTDSVNYALGLLNGLQIKQYYLANDSSDEAVTEFIDALEEAYLDKEEELSDLQKAGRQIGTTVKQFEKEGLAENPAWPVNEKVFFQGLVNALFGDTTMMGEDDAEMYVMAHYQAMMMGGEKTGEPVLAKCPSKAKTIELANENDSLNYAFGRLNGQQLKLYVIDTDTTEDNPIDVFIANVNKGLKSNVRNPQLVSMAKNIGTAIREQEPTGLLGIDGLETNYELIKQGFINGLYSYTEQMDQAAANQYLDEVITQLRYGALIEEGEHFLAENAKREEVQVTESGLQYEVIEPGKGPKPTATSTVKVHYEGTLIDGTVFDSSYMRGEPIEFPLNGVIAGWTEGLQLMSVGAKYKLYIPYQLGYGERGAGQSIPPYSALIFTVELLEIK